jgi:hypothetical protein
MLAILLALASAAGYGGSDYAGGLAARRGSVIRITILAQAVGAVIVRGTVADLGHPAQLPEVVRALAAKYTAAADGPYLPDADPDIIYALRPQSAMMWCLADYDGSQRRWRS